MYYLPLLADKAVLCSCFLVALCCTCFSLAGAAKTNLLLIVVDDMNANSVGAFGAVMSGTTPNIDELASEGIRFEKAHVQVANCKPSRNVMWSGVYPHSNKVEGFYQVANPEYLTLSDLMQEVGYFTAIRHKSQDSTPYSPYPWDLVLDTSPTGDLLERKDPQSFGASTARAIEAAKSAGKPFSLLINIADPHLPFYGLNRKGESVEDVFMPSRVFTPKEVSVPPYLVDDPVVREELAQYYSTVRRADDAVGEVNAEEGLTSEQQSEAAKTEAKAALGAYWNALEGTIDPSKVENAAQNALIGNVGEVTQQILERFHPEDRIMAWFDFFNHDSNRVCRDMTAYMEQVVPGVEKALRER